jgi:hypothetical protein
MENNEILYIPSLDVFGDWNTLQKFLERRGNPLYSIGGDLVLIDCKNLTSLGNIVSIDGSLELLDCKNLTSLGTLTSVCGSLDLCGCKNLMSLGNLTSVGGYLDLRRTKIESFGNLTSVGGFSYFINTPIQEKYSEKEIRQMVDIGGNIYL